MYLETVIGGPGTGLVRRLKNEPGLHLQPDDDYPVPGAR